MIEFFEFLMPAVHGAVGAITVFVYQWWTRRCRAPATRFGGVKVEDWQLHLIAAGHRKCPKCQGTGLVAKGERKYG